MAKQVKAYFANAFGFYTDLKISELQRKKKEIEKLGVIVLEPFELCEEFLDTDILRRLEVNHSYREVQEFWDIFNRKSFLLNREKMDESDIMVADYSIFDAGVFGETGDYFGRFKGNKRIYGLNTNVCPGENIACGINLMIDGYVQHSGGRMCTTEKEWYNNISGIYD
jgi:hypothetical protein